MEQYVVTDYVVVDAYIPSNLGKAVLQYLEKGYQLHGAMVSTASSSGRNFAQALVKYGPQTPQAEEDAS